MGKFLETEDHLNKISMQLFGRSRYDPCCLVCGSSKIEYSDFRDNLSWKEFHISRMCQSCQNERLKE